MAALCIAFGANTIAMKLTLTGMGILTSAGLRFAIAAVVIFLWVRVTGRNPALPEKQRRPIFLSSAVFAIQLALYYFGVAVTDASRATLIVNAQPFFVLLLAHFFVPGDRITLRKIIGMLLGFSGLLIILKKPAEAAFSPGDLYILAGTLIWAGNTIYIKRIIHKYKAFHFPLYSALVAAPVYLLGGYFFDSKMIFKIDSVVISSLLYQGVITASLGFVIWNSLMQRFGAVTMHSYIFIMPFSGVLFGGLILGEDISSKLIISLLLIASGILIVHLKGKYTSIFPFRRGSL